MRDAIGTAAPDGRFVRAVEAIYDAAPDPSLWPQALQAVADVFGDVGAVLVYQRDDGGFGAISSRSSGALLLAAAGSTEPPAAKKGGGSARSRCGHG